MENLIRPPNQSVGNPIQGEHGQTGEQETRGLWPAGEPGHPARQRDNEEEPGRDVPGREPAFPVTIKSARRHIGEIERRRAEYNKHGFPYPASQTPWQEIQRGIEDQLSAGMVLKGISASSSVALGSWWP